MRRLWLCLLALPSLFAQTTPNIRVDVNLVTASASVTDRKGALIQNLRREDFVLLDNGEPRDVKFLWQEVDLPLTIGLIVDVSGSQMGLVNKHRDDVNEFLRQVIGPRDRAFLMTVASDVKLVTDLTGSVAELSQGIDQVARGGRNGTQLGDPCTSPDAPTRTTRIGRTVSACGGTALWNGVYSAARLKMKPLTGRKALIVFSDGLDTGSFHSLTDAIEAAQGADTLVYTLREISPLMGLLSPMAAVAAQQGHSLERLSNETGGHPFSGTKGNPRALFKQIENELRSLYVLGFAPPESASDGARHRLEIKTTRTDLTVRARKTYSFAPTVE